MDSPFFRHFIVNFNKVPLAHWVISLARLKKKHWSLRILLDKGNVLVDVIGWAHYKWYALVDGLGLDVQDPLGPRGGKSPGLLDKEGNRVALVQQPQLGVRNTNISYETCKLLPFSPRSKIRCGKSESVAPGFGWIPFQTTWFDTYHTMFLICGLPTLPLGLFSLAGYMKMPP